MIFYLCNVKLKRKRALLGSNSSGIGLICTESQDKDCLFGNPYFPLQFW